MFLSAHRGSASPRSPPRRVLPVVVALKLFASELLEDWVRVPTVVCQARLHRIFYVQRPLYAGTSYNVCLTAPRHAWPNFRSHFRSSLSGARPSHGQYDTLRERATRPTSCHGAARDREPGGSILLPVAFVLMIRMPVVVEVVPTLSDVPPHGILADRLQADRTGLLFLRSGAELLSHADVQRARCSWACRLTTYTRHGSSSGCTKIIMYAQVSCSCRLHAPG